MHNFKVVAAVLLGASLLVSGCVGGDPVEYESATVSRDCTGTYVDVGDKHYRVCNRHVLKDADPQDTVEIAYTLIDQCKSYEIICRLYHPYDEDINVDSVKK